MPSRKARLGDLRVYRAKIARPQRPQSSMNSAQIAATSCHRHAERRQSGRQIEPGQLFLLARQKYPQRPLDRAQTSACNCLSTVGPGLDALEVGVTAHERTAIFGLILPIAALPRALQVDVQTAECTAAPLLYRLNGIAKAYDMSVLDGVSGNRDFDRLAVPPGREWQLVANQCPAINRS